MTLTRRLLAALALALPLGASTALAQASKDPVADSMPEAPPADDNSGSSLYGYLAFAALGGLALFIVCKSSRR